MNLFLKAGGIPGWCLVAAGLTLGGEGRAQETWSEMIPTGWVEQGQPVSLELVFYRPPGEGPFPTMVFNHGSTGTGSDPALFRQTWVSPGIAGFFNARGWLVVFPQRRGRGKSGGLYDEGFAADRSGYTCEPARSLAGMERALADLDVVTAHLRRRPEVQVRQVVMGGWSRGGILAVVFAGTRPGICAGALNFVGGWMSDQCANPTAINTVSFARGGDFPGETLWIYGENDPYYRLSHSQANYAAFMGAGGRGDFEVFNLGPGSNGHNILGAASLWGENVAGFLSDLPPVVPAAKPRILSREILPEGKLRLQIASTPGIRYRVWRATGPGGEAGWEAAGEPVVAAEETLWLEAPLDSTGFRSLVVVAD